MSNLESLYESILNEKNTNINFNALCRLLKALGFSERIRGDHHIFSMDGVSEIINLQPDGTDAKPYQVRQVRNMINKYKMGGPKNVEL